MPPNKKRKFKQNLKHFREVSTTIDVLKQIEETVGRFDAADSRASKKRVQKEAITGVHKSLSSLQSVCKAWTDITGHGHHHYALQAHNAKTKEELYDARIAAGKKSTDTDWNMQSPIGSKRLRSLPKTRSRFRKKVKLARRKCMSPTFKFPPPTNGVEYQPESAIKHIIAGGTANQASVINYMVRKSLVPVKKGQMRKLVAGARKKQEVPKRWGFQGCKRFVTTDEILGRIAVMAGGSGDGLHFDNEQMFEAIESIQKEKHTASDKAPSSYKSISRSSKYNYISAIRCVTDVSSSARYKNVTRSAAENSVMGITALVHTVGSTHYTLCENGIGDTSIKKASAGAKLMYDLVSKSNDNAALKPINPSLIFSTDDSANFVSKVNENTGKVQWVYRLDCSTPLNENLRSNHTTTTFYQTCSRMTSIHLVQSLWIVILNTKRISDVKR